MTSCRITRINSTTSHPVHTHINLVFFAGILAAVVSLRYFAFVPAPAHPATIPYLGVATISQMFFLALLAGLCTSPILLIRRERLRQNIFAIILTLLVGFLLIDTVVFAQYRFHINTVVLKLVFSGDVVDFPLSTWLVVVFAIVASAVIVSRVIPLLAAFSPALKKKLSRWFFRILLLTLLATHFVHIWASAYGFTPVTMTAKYLPLFKPATANSQMEKWGWVDPDAQRQRKLVSFKQSSDVKYPRAALQTRDVEKPVNIMLLVIDSWRYDSFNAEQTPVMWEFSESGVIFDNHYSSGNSTRAGIFGLFYGIPATYWHAFFANTQSPVLMQRLQALGYDFGIFASAKLTEPEFHKTVFADLDELRVRSEGKSPAVRDLNLTQDWLQWYRNERDPDAPAFSFLFYDAPHGYDFPTDYPHRFEPMLEEVNYLTLDNYYNPEPLFNRYRTSVHYTDSLVAQVLSELEQSGDLDNTLVIITGDHGQEFNDNKQGFWGHNSNFTDAQVKVPMIIRGPEASSLQERAASEFYTVHEDVSPTLLANYLGLENPAHDYSTGHDLRAAPVERDWRIASMYSRYAIIHSDTILEILPAGQHSLYDLTNRPTPDAPINPQAVSEVFEMLRWFSH